MRDVIDVTSRQVLMDGQFQDVAPEKLGVWSHLVAARLTAVIPELERVHAVRAQPFRRFVLVANEDREEQRAHTVGNGAEHRGGIPGKSRCQPAARVPNRNNLAPAAIVCRTGSIMPPVWA